jgi:hypothetical protein
MLVKLGERYVNSSAVRSLTRIVGPDGAVTHYDVEYDDGSRERVACDLDLDEQLLPVPAPQDHAVLVMRRDGRIEEHELLMFQVDPARGRQPPVLITRAGRFMLGPTVGLRGPSGRVSTAQDVYETEAEFGAAGGGTPPR